MYRLAQFLHFKCVKKDVCYREGKLYCSTKIPSKRRDLYNILGISSSATQSEIKQAYYSLTLQYHPDRNEGCEEAATKFREVSEAYEVLGNTVLRERYDMGAVLPLDSSTLQPRKATVQHRSKHQQFYDKRNKVVTPKKPTVGDHFELPRRIQPEKKPFHFDTPEEREKDQKFKAALLAFLLCAYFFVHRNDM